MTKVSMLTTLDNPYDPFDNFESWFLYDVEKGYNSCEYLARILKVSDALSEYEYNSEVSNAIDEIIKLDFRGIYKKVTRDVEEVKIAV